MGSRYEYDYSLDRAEQPQYYDPPQQHHSPPPQLYDPHPQGSPSLNPAAHPDSAFQRLRAERRYSREGTAAAPPYTAYASPSSPPEPPTHHDEQGRLRGRELGYTDSTASATTPGVDNFGETAGGGISGIAMSIADAHARESGLEAMRNTPGYNPRQEMPPHEVYERPAPHQDHSSTSLTPLGAAAFPPGVATPHSMSTLSRSPPNSYHEAYSDTPYRYSRNVDPNLSEFDPNSIEDDGDDGLEYRTQNRRSMLSLGHHSDRDIPAGAAVAGGAAAGGIMGTFGGMVGRNAGSKPHYNAVGGSGDNYDLGGEKKSEWLSSQGKGNKKLRLLVIALVAFLIVGGIAGGIAGGILGSRKNTASSNSEQSASADTASNGDLNKNSAEIQALMNNKNLHKIFPGIDYTPMYTQYPDCLSYPASQNNVTRDMAVLSQLTNIIRLYGTDCNQTELVLHSISQLGLNDTVKVWMGVWQDTNTTTNARQLAQMYDIFDKYGGDPFVGVIVGNEVLFRKDMTVTQLGSLVSGVRSNLTAKGINLPVASSDLGDNWTAEFAEQVDYVMANIHPFFAGVDSKIAATWTWDFWTTNDTPLKANKSQNIISETGWPSTGGTDCGGASSCPGAGSVAGVSEMNDFMNGWVCDALANGTNYFWFEAFDEPWKIVYDTPGQEWEDHWGLMDVNRNLKPGVIIPDCGGKTVD